MVSRPPPPIKTDQPTVLELFKNSNTYWQSSERAKLITAKIANFIVKDLRPFSVVSNEGFCDLVKTFDSRYVMPSRGYFSQTVIPDMYEKVKTDIVTSLSNITTVALTTDSWTSRAAESFVTIASCHISADWCLKNYVLLTRAMPLSHTGQNIANAI